MAEYPFILLDGGMGRELQSRGLAPTSGAWSAEALLQHQDVVEEVHTAFLEAGADVITTNTYAVVPSLLKRIDLEGGLPKLLSMACFLAMEARNITNLKARIAVSLPPLEMSYRADLAGTLDEMIPIYQDIVHATAGTADLFLAETLTTSREAVATAEAVKTRAPNTPHWVSWTLDDKANGKLRSGETPTEAVRALDGYKVAAFLFNCSSIEAINEALPELREATDRPIGAYANFFQPFDEDWVMGEEDGDHPVRDDITVEFYVEAAKGWREMGASIIGGCCGIGAEYISALRAAFPKGT